jgi:hypothetical protein
MISSGLFFLFIYHAFTLFKILELLETLSFFLQTYAKQFSNHKECFYINNIQNNKRKKNKNKGICISICFD